MGIIVDATIQALHVRLGTAPDTTPGRRSHRPHLQISRNGKRTTLVRGLPSDQTSPAVDGDVSDVTFIGVTFIGHRLYACWAVVEGLTFPTALSFRPDGALHVSNHGYLSALGAGEVLRVELH